MINTLLELGFNLVGLKPRDKIPAVPRLDYYFENRCTRDEVTAWQALGNNLGVITGKISNLIVIDIDSDAAKAIWDQKTLKQYENTMQVKTGKGYHYYLRTTAFSNGLDTTVLHKGESGEIRVKGNRGYVVAPESIHPNGKVYELIGINKPQEITNGQWQALLKTFGTSEAYKDQIGKLFEVEYKVTQGNDRHGDLLRIMYHLIRNNSKTLPEQEVKLFAKNWNEKHCFPAIDEAEFNRTWINASKYVWKNVKEENPQVLEDLHKEITNSDIAEILEITIKFDYVPKIITFNCMLLSQTETDQINLGFQAESSTGKSYIPLEVMKYFPDVRHLGDASPTAFFHMGVPNKMLLSKGTKDEAAVYEARDKSLPMDASIVDLKGQTIIFLDIPDYRLLAKLRPLMSHDAPIIEHDITNKSKTAGNKTEKIFVKGYFTIIFCTTNIKADEQERTRLLLLSPSCDQKKLDAALTLLTEKAIDPDAYEAKINDDPKRKWLIERIKAIRATKINKVAIPEAEIIRERFNAEHDFRIPRHQRDFPRILSSIKAHALLNCFNRERIGNKIIANKTDIDAGFELYKPIADSNEMGLPPFIYNIYQDVILPLGDVMNHEQIDRKYFLTYHNSLAALRFKDIMDQLIGVGFIIKEKSGSSYIYKLVRDNVPKSLVEKIGTNKPAPQADPFWDAFDSVQTSGTASRHALIERLMIDWHTEDKAKEIIQKYLSNLTLQEVGQERYARA